MTFHIISVFPEAYASYFKASILGKAQEKKHISIKTYALGDFAISEGTPPAGSAGTAGAGGWRRTIDDSPYGGGCGMVLKVEPIARAVGSIRKKNRGKTRVILFSTRGAVLNQETVRRLASYKHLILIAGRYEGVDERVAEHIADEEISLGNFVLSGGEIPAMAVVDAVARHIPGVLGKRESLEEIQGSYPVYTKPESYKPKGARKVWKVPKILLSGDHKKVAEWRKKNG